MRHTLLLLAFLLAIASCKQSAKPAANAVTETKITITPGMVTQTSAGDKTAANLFDGNTGTYWFTGWNDANYPMRCVVDFGKTVLVSKVRWFDGTGQPQMHISLTNANTETEGQNEVSAKLTNYNKWDFVVTSDKTAVRYAIITLDSPQGHQQLAEVEFYTSDGVIEPPIDTIVTPPIDTTKPPKPPTGPTAGYGAAINLSGFHWVPLDKLKPFSSLRIFVASNWIWQPGGLYVQPMFQAASKNYDGLDKFFQAAKAQNLDILPCINQTPAWYRKGWPGTDFGDDHPPVKPGMDRTDPKSYADFAAFWFQFVARYGSVKHDVSKLRVDKTPRWNGDVPNVALSGLNLIKRVEIWNEVDKWWKRGGAENAIYMEPAEYAAMLWACYDQCKAADPSVQVVMAGLTGFDMKYLNGMDAYFKSKGVPFKADVINVHHYSNRGNELGVWPPSWYEGGAVPPELDKDFIGIVPIVKFAHDKGKQIWVTEFGSDSKGPSWMYAQPVGGFTSEELQAQWLARTYLEYFRLGVDNAFMFNAINEPGESNGGLYLNSGLLHGENWTVPFQPKPSYTTTTQLITWLSGAKSLSDLSTGSVRVLAFKIDSKTRVVYWSPTMAGERRTLKVGACTLTATEWPQYFDVQ